MLGEINSVIELVMKALKVAGLIVMGIAALTFIGTVFVAISACVFFPAWIRGLMYAAAVYVILSIIYRLFFA